MTDGFDHDDYMGGESINARNQRRSDKKMKSRTKKGALLNIIKGVGLI